MNTSYRNTFSYAILWIVCLLGCLPTPTLARPVQDTALHTLQQQLQQTTREDTARMMAYVALGKYYRDVAIKLDSALTYAQYAEAIAKNYPNNPKTIQVWNLLGIIYSYLYASSQTDKTLRQQYIALSNSYLQRTVNEAKRFHDENHILKGWFNLATNYSDMDSVYMHVKTSLALINYIEAKEEKDLTSLDSLCLCKTYKSLAISLDFDMASKNFKYYLERAKNVCSKSGKDYEHLTVITLELESETFTAADEQRFIENYNLYKSLSKTAYYLPQFELHLANYYFNSADYEKSFQLSKDFNIKALNDISGGDNYNKAFLGIRAMNMGRCAYELNKDKEAKLYLENALTHITSLVGKSLNYEKYITLRYLHKVSARIGDYKRAYQYLQAAKDDFQQMNDYRAQALMAENDVRLEQLKQEKRVQAAKMEVQLKEREAIIEKRQKYVLLCIALLAILSTVWSVSNYLKKKTLSESLVAKNKIISEQATALAESNQLKDKIFALLSHDLRAPINRLIINLLEHSFESQRSYIKTELKGVQDILNNVLYWANMQLKGLTPIYSSVHLKTLVDNVVNEYAHELAEKNITLYNGIDTQYEFTTDENYVKIILRNILSNAIKFTNPEGYIQINYTVKDQHTHIIVRDTGIGISSDKLSSIFDFPAPAVGTKQEKGSGLGLSLSLDIAQKLGGNLEVRSQPQKGTRVTVSLPKAA